MTADRAALAAATDAFVHGDPPNGHGHPRGPRARRGLQLLGFAVGALAVLALTDGVSLRSPGEWWTSPVAFAHLLLWALLWQLLGLSRGTVPGEVAALPPVAGLSYWLTPGTMRVPPWPTRVPWTRGTRRTVADVALYALSLAVPLALLVYGDPLSVAGVGLTIGLLAALGLRDRTPLSVVRLGLLVPLLVASLLPAAQVMIVTKLALAALGWLAVALAASRHLPFALATGLTQLPLPWVRARLWQRDTHDIMPADAVRAVAYSLAALGVVAPAVLLFARGGLFTVLGLAAAGVLLAAAATLCRLETIAVLGYAVAYAFGHGAAAGFGALPPVWLAVVGVAAAAAILVALRSPARTPALWAWRNACDNGPASVWLLRRDAADRFAVPELASGLHLREWARAGLRPTGRALEGLIVRAVGDAEAYLARSCGFVAGAALGSSADTGYSFERGLLAALQQRCRFTAGQLLLVSVEPRAAGRTEQRYRILDAAAGLVEAGSVEADDMIDRVPWRDPTRPAIPVDVEISTRGATGYTATAVIGFFATPTEPDAGWTPVPRHARRPRPVNTPTASEAASVPAPLAAEPTAARPRPGRV